MASDKVQVRYSELAAIARRLAEMSGSAGDVRARLLAQVEVLHAGGWVGRGADTFFTEMERLMFPALGRLEHALSGAADVVGQASERFAEAEQDAASRFRAAGGGLSSGGASGASGGVGGNGAPSGGTGGGTNGGGSGIAKGAAKLAASQIIRNPTIISNLARVLAGEGADDLVNLGRKLTIEGGLANGAKVLARGAGGLIDFAFLPEDQRNAESFAVQVTSGLIQGAVTLNPIGAGVMVGHTVIQVGGSVIAWGGEKIGEHFGLDTKGFVEGVNAVKDTLNVDKHVDNVVQGVVDTAQSVIDFLF